MRFQASQNVNGHFAVRWGVALVAVLAVALALRIWSLDFGLPEITHPDEPVIVEPAARMVNERTFNPRFFRYPGFSIYAQMAIIGFESSLGTLQGRSPEQSKAIFYLGGRVLMALLGTATAAIVGLVAWRLSPPRRAGLVAVVAAAVVAASFLHVRESHVVRPDIPTGFFTALTLLFSVEAVKRDRGILWLAAAASAGLAAAAKYNAGLVAVVPVVAFLIKAGSLQAALVRWQTAIGMGVAAALAFVLLNPFAVLTPDDFLWSPDGVMAELTHYRTGHEGSEGDDSWRWYLVEIGQTALGWSLAPLLGVGLVWTVWRALRGERQVLLVLVFPILYYLFMSSYRVRFDRQLLASLPYLAILSASWIAYLPSPTARPLARLALAALLPALFVPPLVRVIDSNVLLGHTDTRYAVRDWIQANIEPGSSVAREFYSLPLAQMGYRDLPVVALFGQPLTWYESQSVEYVIASSYTFQRYLSEPAKYPGQASFYSRLFAKEPLAGFRSESGYSGPDIYVFRFADAAPAFGEPAAR